MKNIVLFGPPGVGKGTQAILLKNKYNLFHISTGDIFRNNIKNHTDLGKLAKTYIDKGDLVPDEITTNMLKEEVEKNFNSNGFIFDGFPRTKFQAIALDDFLLNKSQKVSGMIELIVDENTLIERLLNRGKTSGRVDDTDESKIKNRLNEYNSKTIVLKNFYKTKGIYHCVSGIGNVEDINIRLSKIFDSL